MLPTSTPPRAYSGAHFGMTLDGFDDIGLFRSIEGGGVKVDVMTYQSGGNIAVAKHIGKPKFEDFKVSCGMAMCRPFYNWIKEFFAGRGTRRNGELLAADFHYNIRARRQFKNALLTEVAMPKLDAADKGPANLTVTVSPEEMLFLKPEGQQTLQLPERTLEQKLWASCNFEVELAGFPDVARHVSKVDGFSVKQKIVEYHGGGSRHPQKHTGRLELPSLNFYVPEAFAYPLIDKAHKRGHKGTKETAPISGSLTTFSNDRTPVFEIAFTGGEIANISVDKSDATSEDIKQVKFEMQIQGISFNHVDIETENAKLLAMLE